MSIVAAYILPHPPIAVHEVGEGREAEIERTLSGFRLVAARIAEIAPETIVIISPHTAYYADWIYIAGGTEAQGNLSQFGAPTVSLSLHYDVAFRERLERDAKRAGVPAGGLPGKGKALDHGIMVPLYFLDKVYPSSSYSAVSIGGSALPRERLMEFGKCLADTAAELNRRCVLLVSGDLSHKLKEDGPYGFDPAGPKFEEAFANVVKSANAESFAGLDSKMCEDAAECGLSGFIMMAGALAEQQRLSGKGYESELISLEGPFGVGYGVASFEFESTDMLDSIKDTDGKSVLCSSLEVDPLVSLAQETVRMYIEGGRVPEPVALPNSEPACAGCFVSIHSVDSGDLRGCIGTISPTQPTLSEEIIRNAIAAATEDPRFPPISPSELSNLRINVDVLGKPEPAQIEDLDPVKYGVIVTQGYKRGLLLPDLEGVDTVDDQLHIACMKAGIDPSSDFNDIDIQRFEVVRHE